MLACTRKKLSGASRCQRLELERNGGRLPCLHRRLNVDRVYRMEAFEFEREQEQYGKKAKCTCQMRSTIPLQGHSIAKAIS